ncbi:MAG: DUF1700 domain-containing protein [Ruminococcaceae bacterium]|nr:DUF1700 domain-containing protein [Oscillospiraceae bacterium]
MNQCDFICELNSRLSGLPEEDINKSVDYYSELIDDYIEDGKSEEEAVAALGSIDDIVNQIYSDIPLSKIVKAKVKPSRTLKVLEIILIVLGSPVWLSILIAVFAVVFSIYVSLWCVVISVFAVGISLFVSSVALFLASIYVLFVKDVLRFVALLGAAFMCAGLGLLIIIGAKYLAKAILLLTKCTVKGIKKMFIKKGELK